MPRVKNLKKKIFLLAFLAMCAGIITSSTVAYFVFQGKADNVITSGLVDIELNRSGNVGDMTDQHVMPGSVVAPSATLRNKGDEDVWVRVKAVIEFDDSSNRAPIELDTSAANQIYLDDNGREWQYEDGYYYYLDILEARKAVEVGSIGNLHFNTQLDDDFRSSRLLLQMEAQAVQSKNNTNAIYPDGVDVSQIQGWPESDFPESD